jgi:putative ABC transport system permease protein
VAAVTPIRYVGVRIDTDRKTVLTIDPSTYDQATSVAPRILSGGGFRELAHTPKGILISKEIQVDNDLKPGDELPVTLFPDDEEKKRNANLRVVGVYRSFPPDSPPAELVMTTAAVRSFLLPPPDFYLARTLAGHPPAAVARNLGQGATGRTFAISTSADRNRAGQRTLASLDLGGLSRIEAIGAALIAAVGIAVLGAFVVLERRREFALLRAVGADNRRLLVLPAQEGAIAVLGSLVLGVPIGLGLSMLAVRVLSLFFTLPPPVIAVPGASLVLLALAIVVTSAGALALALRAVTRIRAAQVLREP